MANRYTQLTPSQFDPLSLEEIMAVPLYKQKQYDDLMKTGADASGLLKLDPDSKFYDDAQNLKTTMDDKLSKLSNELARTGDFNKNKSNFMALKKEYEDLMSPLGLAGQINANKINKENAEAVYLKEATTLGHSPESVQKHLDEFKKIYAETPKFDEKGKIIDFKTDQLPPKYIDHVQYGREFFKDANIDKKEWEKITSSIKYDDQIGQWVETTGSGERLGTNKKQMESALNFLNNQVANANSDLHKSFSYNYMKPEDIMKDYDNMFGIYRQTDEYAKETNQISNFNPIDNGSGKKKEDKPSPQMYREEREEGKLAINDMTVDEVKEKIAILTDPDFDATDPKNANLVTEARRLNVQLAAINGEIAATEEYKNNKQGIVNSKEEIKGLSLPSNFKELLINGEEVFNSPNGIVIDGKQYTPSDLGLSNTKESYGQYKKAQDIISNISNYKSAINEQREEAVKNYKSPYVSFLINKTGQTAAYWKAQESQIVKAINRNVVNQTGLRFDSVFMNGDKFDMANNDNYVDMAKALNEALANGKDISSDSWLVTNEDGMPMIEMSFTPSESFELDGQNFWNDPETSGPISFRIAFDNIDGEKGMNDFRMLFLEPLRQHGGFYGNELVQDMQASARYKDIEPSYINDEWSNDKKIKEKVPYFKGYDAVNLYYDPVSKRHQYSIGKKVEVDGKQQIQAASTLLWSNILPNGLDDVGSIPPGLVDELYDTFIRNNSYGIDDSNFEQLNDADRDRYMIEFFNSHKDMPVQFTSKVNALRSFQK